jgi:cysteine desulfurase / selenocysteine lyase
MFEEVKKEFPIFEHPHNQGLIYFDNAATTQKPRIVVEKIKEFYEKDNANVGRSSHYLAQKAGYGYEESRHAVHKFLNSKYSEEVIFTSGCTESINLIAQSLSKNSKIKGGGYWDVEAGDEVIVSELEHHSNLVPWQMLAQERGLILKIIPLDDKGNLDLEALKILLTPKTKLIAVSHVSNTTGTINPIEKICRLSKTNLVNQLNLPKEFNHTFTLIDGAQAAGHLEVDLQEIDCEFYTFSAHKMYGPTGVGILYGKRDLLERMLPVNYGGGMIQKVTYQNTDFASLPEKFEAGTPNISGVIAFQEAVKFVQELNLKKVFEHETELSRYVLHGLRANFNNLRLISSPKERSGIVSFVLDSIHPFDLSEMLSQQKICIRSGHHCTQPLHDKLNLSGSCRLSFGVYNNKQEIDDFFQKLQKAINILA